MHLPLAPFGHPKNNEAKPRPKLMLPLRQASTQKPWTTTRVQSLTFGRLIPLGPAPDPTPLHQAGDSCEPLSLWPRLNRDNDASLFTLDIDVCSVIQTHRFFSMHHSSIQDQEEAVSHIVDGCSMYMKLSSCT